MNRALPGWAVDVIRDGIPPSDLHRRGDKAVWTALRRTAISAQIRGWTETDWLSAVLAQPGHLGQQARLRSRGKSRRNPATTKPRSAVDTDKQLRSAWKSAAAWLSTRPDVMAAEEVVRRGAERAAAVLEVVQDPAADLTGPERDVLAHAASTVLRLHREGKQVDLAPMARREVADCTGLSERITRTTIGRLVGRNLLQLVVRGSSGVPGAKREDGRPWATAGLYRLPEPDTLARLLSVPENRSVGHHAHISGTDVPDPHGTPAHISGTPETATPKENPEMITLTLSSRDPHALAAALRSLQMEHAQVTVEEPAEEPPQNGRRLRMVRDESA